MQDSPTHLRHAALVLSLVVPLLALGCGGDGAGPASDAADSVQDDGDLDSASPNGAAADGSEPDASEPDATEPDDGGADAEVLPDTGLYARKITSEADLIGGPGAYAQVGRAWLLGNELVHFAVQDIGTAVGLSVYGGNLVDADLRRPPGVPGADAFRETFALADFRVLVPEGIEVLRDGSDGEAAELRVWGKLGPSRILDAIDLLGGSTELGVEVIYAVRPDEPVLWIRTALTNPGTTQETVSVGDFLAYGKQLSFFTREDGHDAPSGEVAALACRGDDVSYAFGRAEGLVTLPLVDAGGTAGFLGEVDIPAGETVTIERFLALGDGSPSSALDVALALRGEAQGQLEGTVRDADGAPVPGIMVTAMAASGKAVAEDRTDAQGHYAMGAPAGTVSIFAWAPDRLRGAAEEVAVAVGEESSQDLTVGTRGLVVSSITSDGAAAADGSTPVRVSLALISGEALDPALGESVPQGQARMVFAGAGLLEFGVRPGTYRATVSRGPEFDRLVIDPFVVPPIDPSAGDPTPAALEGHLQRVIDTSGWVGCDFHQHTIGSLDSSARLEEKVRENLSAGLDCAAITDHDSVVDVRPVVTALGADGLFRALVGNEISVNGVGHFNAYPLPVDPADPWALSGAQLWAGRTVAELFALVRALPGDPVIQVNHPRDSVFKGWFNQLALDPVTALAGKGELAADFDALEVNDWLGNAAEFTLAGWAGWSASPGTSVPVLADWMGLLANGHHVAAVGNSDSHDPGDNVGYPRTYLRIPSPADGSLDGLEEHGVADAIERQLTHVSRGAFLRVDVNGQPHLGHEEPVVLTEGATAELHVVAEVPPWLELDTVELYAGGLLVDSRPAAAPPEGSTVWADETFTLAPEADTFYVVVTRGPERGSPIFGGFTFALMGPIYVDADGDGAIEPRGPLPVP